MQRLTELVPILGPSGRLRESSGKLLHFGKIPKKFGQNLAKKKSAIYWQFLRIVYQKKERENISAIFNENVCLSLREGCAVPTRSNELTFFTQQPAPRAAELCRDTRAAGC